MGPGRDAVCNHITEGDLLVAGILRAYKESGRNASWESQSNTQCELISWFRDQILKESLCLLWASCLYHLCVLTFLNMLFFSLSFLREAGHSA